MFGLIKHAHCQYLPVFQVSSMCLINVAVTKTEKAPNKNPSKHP